LQDYRRLHIGASPRKTLLTVDFKSARPQIQVRQQQEYGDGLGPMKGGDPSKTKINKSSESLEMVVSYTPVEVDPYGVSTIRADCESAKAKRTSESARQQNWQERRKVSRARLDVYR